MSKISKELTISFTQGKYSMSSGSPEWVDIKGDFDVEADAIMGSVSYEDSNKTLSVEKIGYLKQKLEGFKNRVDNYVSKDDMEEKEKRILLNRIKIGLEIYDKILS